MTRIIDPTGPYSFITERLAIGGLTAYGEPQFTRGGFHHAFCVAFEFGPDGKHVQDGVTVETIGFDDSMDIGPQLPKIELAVAAVLKLRSQGKTILVTCAQGRNRSGVVAAEVLIRGGDSPERVIRSIKERRQRALTNDAFVAWLRRPR